VIKIEWIKTHDVFTAAFVIAVAVPALGVFGVFYATMKTFFGFDVIFDVFMIMAVKAKFVLTALLKGAVTVFTLLFKFGVVLGELSWHHQRLKIDR